MGNIKDELPGGAVTEIWKYPLNTAGPEVVELPGPGRLFHVGLDPAGRPCAWIEVNPGGEIRKAVFTVYGTGHEISDNADGFYRWGEGFWVQDMFEWHLIISMERP